jgi:hypothetical protein
MGRAGTEFNGAAPGRFSYARNVMKRRRFSGPPVLPVHRMTYPLSTIVWDQVPALDERHLP